MKTKKNIIHIAEHLPTGARVPMIVSKVDDKNIIQDYKEYLEHRRGFTLLMLQNRWDMCREYVLEMLQKYKVPAHINHKDAVNLEQGRSPIDIAIFFEEYIFGLEEKEKLSHSKLKARTVENIRSH
jgi:hypothetical protein